MRRRSALDSAGMPPALLKPAPRRVQVNTSGGMMLIIAAALVVIGIWGGIELWRRAETAERHVELFASERVVTAGDVLQLRKRGGDDDDRIVAHYRYAAQGRELTGQTTLRRGEREKYAVGSPVAVWYLPTEPEASWLDGYSPRLEARWPGSSRAARMWCLRDRADFCSCAGNRISSPSAGRPWPRSRRSRRKRSDEGTFWMVHYEWTTMSGATRKGKYHHGKKHVPAVGAVIPIVYDRDNTFRHSKYPMPFVRVGNT